ncbi:S-adenosylmethionine decarboxylase family protein [Ligilactobacillus salivarius]|uniref:S-adenosylmethionine decarboxylase family protein n=1 Tax=Ligilactobacillus salivarius TaxID=1624 RepID=UPI000BAF8B30|nr:S-adenosylmethionine decarboxylase [Ligilactobacillus salivarius]
MKAEIFNKKWWINETEPQKLKTQLTALLVSSGFEIVDYVEHYFQPQGFTALWLISESHLAVHTWPEESKTYIELSSCNLDKQKTFIKKMGGWEV